MNKKEKWTADHISDQKGKVVVVTGSSSGIGFEAARVIAEKNAEVIIAVRNEAKGENAVKRIKARNPGADVKVMLLDLASLRSVSNFVNEFKQTFTKLDLLINNAGVMIPPYSKTEDGFELQMGTNHMGHFALTLQLLPLMEKTPGSRIVNVSSMAHKYGRIDFEDLAWEKRKYKASRAYGDSKIANLYFTSALQKKLSQNGKNPLVTAAHPGWTATELQRHNGVINFMNRFFAMNTEQGTLPTLRAAFDKEAKGGEFYGPDGFMEMRGFPVKVSPNKLAQDTEIAEKLWQVSEEATNLSGNFKI